MLWSKLYFTNCHHRTSWQHKNRYWILNFLKVFYEKSIHKIKNRMPYNNNLMDPISQSPIEYLNQMQHTLVQRISKTHSIFLNIHTQHELVSSMYWMSIKPAHLDWKLRFMVSWMKRGVSKKHVDYTLVGLKSTSRCLADFVARQRPSVKAKNTKYVYIWLRKFDAGNLRILRHKLRPSNPKLLQFSLYPTN